MINNNKIEIDSLISELKYYDNEAGYKLSYEKIKKKLKDTLTRLIECKEECVEHLHPLLEHEETWSCVFALEVLREIMSPKSIPVLIKYIKNNENGDYWEGCDDALTALNKIGEPAILPLLAEIKASFQKKEYLGFLVGAFTGIKHDKVYLFMEEILKDYLSKPDEYDEWFEIEQFTVDFDKQGKKEILPLLKELAARDNLSSHETIEIKSTIEAIEDPEKFEKEIKEMSERFIDYETIKKEDVNQKELLEKTIEYEEKKEYDEALECLHKILKVYPESYHALLLKVRINRKSKKPDMITLNKLLKEAKKQKVSAEIMNVIGEEQEKVLKLYEEVATTPDEEFLLNFKCNDCKKRQNVKTGLIWHVECEKTFLFENEVLCKNCFSHNLELTKDGHMDLLGQQIRIMTGESCGIRNVNKKIYAENKLMSFNKSYPYFLNRIKSEPNNGELQLRAGNSARKINKYEEAIEHYKKALKLNPKLIAIYFNLVEIFQHRAGYYNINEAKDKACSYLERMKKLYDSRDFDPVTIANHHDLISFIRMKEHQLGISSGCQFLNDEDIKIQIKKESTLDTDSVIKKIKKGVKESEEEARLLLEANKGMIVLESYHVFDKKTEESQNIQVTCVEPIDASKLCVCGSRKNLMECCFKHIKKKEPFVINTDHATYSVSLLTKRKIRTDEDYNKLMDSLKEDPRFYCEEEKNGSARFQYYGETFFTVRQMGTTVFGTMKIKHGFSNKALVEIETLSQNRLESLINVIKKHLGDEGQIE